MAWLAEHKIELLEWPPCSPDLSPIENVWSLLKRQLRKRYPHLRNLKDNRRDRAIFAECVDQTWRDIPQHKIRGLLESLPNRLRAVIRARGWYTKY
jgi:transposase